jgi:hypothetical protein
MKFTIHKVPKMARCYRCGSPEPVVVCHQCGVAICEAHIDRKTSQSARAEFLASNFGKKNGGKCQPIECMECAKPRGFLARISYWFARVTGRLRYGNRPLLPLFSLKQKILIKEVVSGQISLNEQGDYRGELKGCKGNLQAKFEFDSNSVTKQFAKYKRKLRLKPEKAIDAQLGFVQFCGSVSLMDTTEGETERGENLFSLTINANESHIFTHHNTPRKDRQICKTIAYRFAPHAGLSVSETIPITILPFLRASDLNRTLEFLVYVHPEAWPTLKREFTVENLKIRFPHEMGRVVSTDPSAIPDSGGDENWNGFIWKRLKMGAPLKNSNPSQHGEETEQEQVGTLSYEQTESHLAVFLISFDKEITPISALEIVGKICVRLKGNFSGINSALLLDPFGNLIVGADSRQDAVVEVDFVLSLSSLLVTDTKTVSKQLRVDGVLPDFRTIYRIVDELRNSSFLARHISESPPETSRKGAYLLERQWDIRGVYYAELWPLEFHVVISGEQYDGPDGRVAGYTEAEVSLRASFHKKEMSEHIDTALDNLDDYVRHALESLPRREGLGDVLKSSQRSLGEEFLHTAGVEDHAKISRKAKLDQLDSALIEGRISEEVYKMILKRLGY